MRQLRPSRRLPAGSADWSARWTPERGRGQSWRSPLPRAAGPAIASVTTTQLNVSATGRCRQTTTNPLCLSCRLTRVIPNLADAGPPRRLVPPRSREAPPAVHADRARPADAQPRSTIRSAGLTFEFLADADPARRAGADRTRRRRHHRQHRRGRRCRARTAPDGAARAVSDAPRTHAARERSLLLGSLSSQARRSCDEFRALFGDERADYAAALRRALRARRRRPTGRTRFVSAYASAHPWEDWAETWAHYLHMVDTLETAAACGLSLRPRRARRAGGGEDAAPVVAAAGGVRAADRQLVSADLRPEQPESRAGARRRVSRSCCRHRRWPS